MAATGGALPRDHSGGVKTDAALPALRCGPLWMHTCVDGGAAVVASARALFSARENAIGTSDSCESN